MTPSEACILLQAYISQVNRLKANEYKRNNERTYDLKQVSFVNKYQIRLLTSIGVFNKSGSEKARSLGEEALWLEVDVREWSKNGYLRELEQSKVITKSINQLTMEEENKVDSPIRGENPVDIQECHEYITTLQNDLRDGWGEQAGKKLLEDIKDCLIWVELNG